MVVVAVKGVKAIPYLFGLGVSFLNTVSVYIYLRLFTVCPGLPRFGAVQLFSHNNELDRANGTPTE